jgi:hypothetical protein
MAAQTPYPVGKPESRAALESIGHLTQKICAIWGTEDLDAFLSKLVMDARDGERQGLPFEVATDILFLAQINKRRRAIDLGKRMSMDPDAAYKLIDEQDQSRLRLDPFDDPSVSRDTVITRADRVARGPERRQARPTGSQAEGLGELLMMLLRSRWLVWSIVAVLSLKLVWPIISPFF